MRRNVATFVLLIVTILAPSLFGCSWAEGYFHQLTLLKGTVVGRDLHRFGPLGYVRWLRQKPVPAAKLTLYKYVWPLKDVKQLREVAKVTADRSGNFDFGGFVPEGHYFLGIRAGDLSDWYDFEITNKAKPTKSVMIDISPSYPDCKGGHEFVVYN